jgi:hypothetical protein
MDDDVWADDEIVMFLDELAPLIHTASLVTVSVSYGSFGNEESAYRIAAIVMPRIAAWRHQAANL